MLYKNTVKQSNYIRHALGGLDTYQYLNTIEALENSYKKGFRLFEVDVRFTSDDKLVLTHGWEEVDYIERMGISYDEQNSIPTYKEFMNYKIQGRYSATSFNDLVKYMKNNRDIFVLLDFGKCSYEETLKAYKAVVSEANSNNKILRRFIVGGHTTDMIRAVKEVYDFDLINLYLPREEKREEELKNLDNYILFCKENNISSFSVSTKNYTEEVAQKMKESNLISYVFTSDNKEEVKKIFDMGANIVGTNFLE